MDQQLNQIAQMARQLAQGERRNEQTLKQLSQQVRDQQHSRELENLANAEGSAYSQLERIASLCDEAIRMSQSGSSTGAGSSLQSSTGTGSQTTSMSGMSNTSGMGGMSSQLSSSTGGQSSNVNRLMQETDSSHHGHR